MKTLEELAKATSERVIDADEALAPWEVTEEILRALREAVAQERAALREEIRESIESRQAGIDVGSKYREFNLGAIDGFKELVYWLDEREKKA